MRFPSPSFQQIADFCKGTVDTALAIDAKLVLTAGMLGVYSVSISLRRQVSCVLGFNSLLIDSPTG